MTNWPVCAPERPGLNERAPRPVQRPRCKPMAQSPLDPPTPPCGLAPEWLRQSKHLGQDRWHDPQ